MRRTNESAASIRSAVSVVHQHAARYGVRPCTCSGSISGGGLPLHDGCSSMTPSSKTQTMGVYALGIPGIAIITQSSQNEDASGGDKYAPTQANPVTTTAGK
ncbi:MAG: hypothetical protein IJ146_12910 [Kiritimatiellae bacterium]|nr:hypothetical protein [Kiritimatiellia bacterium]